jgi:hypothetical protein
VVDEGLVKRRALAWAVEPTALVSIVVGAHIAGTTDHQAMVVANAVVLAIVVLGLTASRLLYRFDSALAILDAKRPWNRLPSSLAPVSGFGFISVAWFRACGIGFVRWFGSRLDAQSVGNRFRAQSLGLADEKLVAAAVQRKAGCNHETLVLEFDIEAAHDPPAENHPVDQPTLLVEVLLLVGEIARAEELAVKEVVSFEVRDLADAASPGVVLVHHCSPSSDANTSPDPGTGPASDVSMPTSGP